MKTKLSISQQRVVGKEINVGSLIGSVKSRAKARAAKANGAKGGRPRKEPQDANTIAHSVVSEAAKLADAVHFMQGFKRKVQSVAQQAKRQGRPPVPLKVLPSPKSPKRGK